MTTFTRTRTFRQALLDEPIQLAISQPHQVLISSVSVTLMALFFHSSGVVPHEIAVAGAVGVEYAYLKGLSDAAYTKSAWGQRLVWGAFAIIVIAGISVLLRDSYHVAWMVQPSTGMAVVLALLHIIPLAFIGLCSANLHMEAEAQRITAEQSIRDRAEQMRLTARQQEAERQQRRAQLADEIEAERQRRALDLDHQRQIKEAEIEAERQKAMARIEYQVAQMAARADAQTPAQEPHAAAQSRVRKIEKSALYDRVRAAYAADPAFNRADMARETGWSEAMVRKVLQHIKGESEDL